MGPTTNHLRLFGLLALLLPLYGGIRLWLLAEPPTRVEVRTVPELVPVEVPVQVEVPVERLIFIPVPVPGQVASADDADESAAGEEPGGALPLFLALPGSAFAAQLDTAPTVEPIVAAEETLITDAPNMGAGQPAPAAPGGPARAPPPVARPSGPPPPPVTTGDQPVAPIAPVTGIAAVVAPSLLAPIVVFPPPLAAPPVSLQAPPAAPLPVVEIQSAAPPPTLPQTPSRVQPADAIDDDGPVARRPGRREKPDDDRVAKRETDDKDDGPTRGDDHDGRRGSGTKGDGGAPTTAPAQVGGTPSAASARTGGVPAATTTNRTGGAPAIPERGNRPSATPASNSQQSPPRTASVGDRNTESRVAPTTRGRAR